MISFVNIDKKFEKIGFKKIEEDKYGVVYLRNNKEYKYTQVIHIAYKDSGNHIVQSYDRDVRDENDVGNICIGLTYLETKLVLEKFRQMKRKYKWKQSGSITTYIYLWLLKHYPIREMFEDYEINEDGFIYEIKYGLEEIGFY